MPKVVRISRPDLKKLYLKEFRGSYEIAKILNCSPSLIRKRLEEFGIKSRTVQEAKALTRPRYPRTDFSGDLIEKAYLIGFRLGDLYAVKTHPNSPTIRVGTNSTKEDQLLLVEGLFSKYGHVKRNGRDKNGAIHVRAFVNNSFNFLVPKEDKIDSWILKNKDYFIAFLAGYADAEGTFCICGGDGVFSIKSQDKNTLFSIWKTLNRLGILCKKPSLFRVAGFIDYRGIKNNKDAYIFTIYRKDSLLKLIDLLKPYLKHGKRIKDMLLVEQNINNRNIKYNFKKDNRWLKTYKT
ncbi:MAG: hypothetical protein HYT67_01075 [Candidatus Yanofskybacteria bacterium]|nr:hypothetical protein [Candidatus Yanofskybacteria bacterium]